MDHKYRPNEEKTGRNGLRGAQEMENRKRRI